MKKILFTLTLSILVVAVPQVDGQPMARLAPSKSTFKIGWISALTGPVAKYGAYEAAQLAVEDINSSGGVLGKPLELIVEDGKCEGKEAATAAQKLINIDRVHYILGGHCSTESLAVAPITERNKVLTLASISSSPALSNAGKYIFRTSPVSTAQSELLADYLLKHAGVKSLAILHEDTSYVDPIASKLQEKFEAGGGKVGILKSFNPGTSDFRSIIAMVKASDSQAVFLGVQAQETGYWLVKQLQEMGIRLPIFGNEALGNAIAIKPQDAALFEGIIFGEAQFDPTLVRTAAFIKRFNERNQTTMLPYGVWTAESYDAVRMLAELINKCGDDVDKVRNCLHQIGNYQGVSGNFGIDANGDGIRKYNLKIIKNGNIENIPNS